MSDRDARQAQRELQRRQQEQRREERETARLAKPLVERLRDCGPFEASDGYMSIALPHYQDALDAADEIERLSAPVEPPVLSRTAIDEMIAKALPYLPSADARAMVKNPEVTERRIGANALRDAILESLPTQTKAVFSGPQPDWAFEYQRLQSAVITFICAATGTTANEVPLDTAGLSAILESLSQEASDE